jgi:ketosteroid isomerase-like protein
MIGDTTFFAHALADEFQLTGGQAALTKGQFLAAVAADSGRIPPSRAEETTVHVYGNVAVVTGLIRYDMPGGAASLPSRFTEVWVKQDERWRAVHGHYNPIQAPPRTLVR